MKNGLPQCKDIEDKPILEFLDLVRRRKVMATAYPGFGHSITRAFASMPANADNPPQKLVLAKMGQLIKRGIVDGCICGCRGDFRLTEKGRSYLESLNLA